MKNTPIRIDLKYVDSSPRLVSHTIILFPYTRFWIIGRNQWNMAMSQNPTQKVPK